MRTRVYRRVVFFSVVLACLALPDRVRSEVLLAKHEVCCASVGIPEAYDSVGFRMSFDEMFPDFDNGPYLFDTLILTAADQGRVFRADQSNTQDWAAVVGLLTDGLPQDHNYVLIIPPGENQILKPMSVLSESKILLDRHPDLAGGADLAGADITAVEIEFTLLVFEPLQNDPNGASVRYGRVLRIYGNVPEPSTIVVAGLLAPLILCRRRVLLSSRQTNL